MDTAEWALAAAKEIQDHYPLTDSLVQGIILKHCLQESTWFRFLAVRRELINDWRREGKSCTEIARTLSMDPGQVFLISQVETGPAPDDARQAIIECRDRALRYLAEHP